MEGKLNPGARIKLENRAESESRYKSSAVIGPEPPPQAVRWRSGPKEPGWRFHQGHG